MKLDRILIKNQIEFQKNKSKVHHFGFLFTAKIRIKKTTTQRRTRKKKEKKRVTEGYPWSWIAYWSKIKLNCKKISRRFTIFRRYLFNYSTAKKLTAMDSLSLKKWMDSWNRTPIFDSSLIKLRPIPWLQNCRKENWCQREKKERQLCRVFFIWKV